MMKFQIGGTTMTLQGDPSLSKTLVTLKAMMKAFKNERGGVLLELGSLNVDQRERQQEMPTRIEQVLDEFNTVFEELRGLPPQRDRDHTITVQSGTAPFNVRPYCYPHIQKNEIEKLV